MSSQVVEYVLPPGFRWLLAGGIAAFVLTRTAWFYVGYAILFLWAGASMIVRLITHDSSWWVDPAIFIGVLAALFLALVVLGLLKGSGASFQSGQPIRATLLSDRLLLIRGDSLNVLQRTGIRRVRAGYGLVFIDADDGQHLVPRRALNPQILSELELMRPTVKPRGRMLTRRAANQFRNHPAVFSV